MSTITTLNDGITANSFRTQLNTNFSNLNTDKAEKTGKLSQFASTSSSELDGVISDNTGSGGFLVFSNSPALTTPSIAAINVSGGVLTLPTGSTATIATEPYALVTPDFYKYSIVTSVASGNLTVALKNYEGNDPTPTKPVKIQIGGVVRTITSALSDTFPAGTNWRNAGSPELATKEIDYFCYVGIDNLNNIRFGCSRIASGNNQNDFSVSGSYTNEKYLMDYGTSFNVVNIGRFNATLSAGPLYTWSIPATSVIINSPIYETRWLDCNIVATPLSGIINTQNLYHGKYIIQGKSLNFNNRLQINDKGTASGTVRCILPFTTTYADIAFTGFICANGANPYPSSRAAPFSSGNFASFIKSINSAELVYSDISNGDWINISGTYPI